MTPVVYIVRNSSPLDPAACRFLLQFVPRGMRRHVRQPRAKKSADNSLVGAALAGYLLWRELGIPLQEQRVLRTSQGKPYLPDWPDAHFNISHSGGLVACAVCDRPVGVDVQVIRPFNPALARRVCSEAERRQLASDAHPAEAFTALWAQKEAWVKLQGTGIAALLARQPLPSGVSFQLSRWGDAFIAVAT